MKPRFPTALAFCALSLAALLLAAGCAAPMPPADATTAWRVGPLVDRQETDSGASLFALHPFYSHEESPTNMPDRLSETDILWPLGTISRRNERTSWRFLFFYGMDGAESRYDDGEDPYRFRIFPLFFSGRTIDDEPYAAIFPLGGTVHNLLFFSRFSFFLFPIYAEAETGDVEMKTFLWPFYLTRHGGGIDQLRVWPFYGERITEGKYQKTSNEFVLWPFWSETHTEGEFVNGDGFVLFPIYGHSKYARKKRGEEETWTVLPPFFAYGRGDDGYRMLNAPWPFFRQLDKDDRRERHYWPVYGSVTNQSASRTYALWPFIQQNTVNDGKYMRSFTHAPLPFYFHSDISPLNPAATNAHVRSYSRVWPLFSHRENEFGTTTRFPELTFWSQSRQVERNWAPLWTLFSHKTRNDGAYCTDILWGLFSWGRNAESKRFFRLFWLFGSRSFNDTPIPDESDSK